MKFLLLCFFLTSIFSSTPSVVYVCNNPAVMKYHYSLKCRGLSSCSHKIIKTTLEKVKKEGKKLCKWED